MKTELIQQVKAGAPAVAGSIWCALTLNQMVAIVTIAYVVLQAAYLARKWWREEQEKP